MVILSLAILIFGADAVAGPRPLPRSSVARPAVRAAAPRGLSSAFEALSRLSAGSAAASRVPRAVPARRAPMPDSRSFSGDPVADAARALKAALTVPAQTGMPVYYPNGRVAIHSYGVPGSTVYYPGGEVATHLYGVKGAAWYYSNGQKITDLAGVVGAAWYYPNGQKITDLAGVAGATWYYPDGSVMTYSGAALSEEQLLQVPSLLPL